MKVLSILVLSAFLIAGCTVFGSENTPKTPYKTLKTSSDSKIEVREYNNLILASTPMEEGRNGSFMRLFDYISGDNEGKSNIEMTAPVFMDHPKEAAQKGEKIEMTAPVFMDSNAQNPTMSFVLPDRYTLDTAPWPTNEAVKLQKLDNYKVAVIRFNGRLSDDNIQKNRAMLEQWIEDNNYKVAGPYKTAGYDAPFTLPAIRRNEVLIPIK